MTFLHVAIITSPFFMLAFFLLLVGAASLLYKLISVTRSAKRKFGEPREKNYGSRFGGIGFIVLLVAVLAGVIFFIYWLGKLKYD